jgi:ABC-type multidrug transport system fused ATPase/permease subunit
VIKRVHHDGIVPSESQPPAPRSEDDFPFLSLLRKLWPFLRRVRRRLWLTGFISLLLTGVEIATPILIGWFVDSILVGLHKGHALMPTPMSLGRGAILALIATGAVLRGVLVARQRSLSGRIGEQVAARLRDALWDHLQHLPLEYTRARGPGQLLLRFIGDARAIQRIVTNGVVQLSQDVLLGCGVLLAMALLNFRMTLAVAVILPVYAAIFRWLNPKLRHESRAARTRRSRLSSYLHDRLVGMAIVKAFVKQAAEAENVKELNADIAKRATRRWRIEGQLQGWTTATIAGGSVAVLALAAREAAAGRLTAGTLVAFLTLLGLLVPVLRRIVAANRYFQEGQISVDRLLGTLALAPESSANGDAPKLRVSRGEVVIQNVSFSYKKGPAILADVSLRARRGGLVAVIGPNGSGKTTLMELLLRFHQPTSGQILIDGQDIAGVSLKSLRSRVGLVEQEAPLFDGTIRENVAYGLAEDAPENNIQHAAQLAGVDRLVAQLPNGWDTRVGRGGRNLSSGQRRRIALARALAVDPPILLLDEPVEALDAETERAFADILRQLALHKTVIVAAHRLPPSLKPDQVFMLSGGAVRTEADKTNEDKVDEDESGGDDGDED